MKHPHDLPELQLQEHTFPEQTDIGLRPTGYEIRMPDTGEWLMTNQEMFAAWLGDRRVWGIPYHGPVYAAGSRTVYTGSRLCGCSVCQMNVNPKDKPN